MEKVIKITLASKIFILEEPAAKILSQYLKKIDSNIKDKEDIKSAVLLEIEKKIAKRLNSIQTNPKKAVTTTHVNQVLSKMGEAKNISSLHNIIHKIISHHQETNKKSSMLPKSFVFFYQFLGLILLTINSLAIIFITIGLFNIRYHQGSILSNIPFRAFGGNYQIPSLVMIYLLLVIPLIFLIILGSSITLKKNLFNPAITWFMLTVWILLIIISTVGAEKIIAQSNINPTFNASAESVLFIK